MCTLGLPGICKGYADFVLIRWYTFSVIAMYVTLTPIRDLFPNSPCLTATQSGRQGTHVCTWFTSLAVFADGYAMP